MRRPAVRFLLTLVTAMSILGVVPATSEAGIIPWAWDTLFGPVGSIQARHAARYCGTNDCGVSSSCCYGPRLFGGLRGWRNSACCANYGYASYGCSSCGTGCSTGCNTGCSTCGVGYGGGYDSGYVYGSAGCGPGGCATGQCNVNYPPGTAPPAFGASPVTPAPAQGAAGAGGPSPNYDNTPGANSVVPPAAPGATTNDGFVPRNGNKSPAPPTGDPTKEEYIPPKVNPPDGAKDGVDGDGNSTTVPPVAPGPAAKKKPTLGEDDEKGGALGPRLELQEKITYRNTVVRVRQAQVPVRVSATANRHGLFPKIAWRSGSDTELAKK